jgi:hypothetical protein
MGEGRGMYMDLWVNLSERQGWVNPGVDGRIILRWILRTELGWLRIETGGRHCKCGNVTSGPLNAGKF